MSRFTDVLRATGDRLALPQPARLRVLLELSADLEDLYDAYRARGCDDAEARRRAVESLDLSPDALAGLGAVHHGPVRRLLDRASPDALARWERTLLGVIGLLTVAVVVSLTDGRAVFRDAGPWVWPVLAGGAAALLVIAWTLGLLAALAWFFLAGRVGRIERDEAAFLLER